MITVFRAGEEDGNLFIAMDYIEGTDLKEMNRSRGVLEPLAWQVGRALDAAHAKALVHRDVKPANVLITDEGGEQHAYLTDFGLTKSVGSESGMTKTGVVVGTIDYIVPEQVAGGPLDGRVDIYSLGCVLWEALTGRVPYQRDSAVAKMYAHMHEPPPALADAMPALPAELGAVVARAMAKEPGERYLSAGDLGEAALAAAEGRVIDLSERSVAIGAAAPGAASAHASTAPAATAPAGTAPAATPPAASTPAGAAPVGTAPVGTAPANTAPAAVTEGGGERRRPRRWLAVGGAAVAAVAVAVVLLLSGGGGDGGGGAKPLSKDKYQDEVIDASQDLTQAFVTVSPTLPESVNDPAEAQKAARGLTKLRNTLDEFLGRLESINAPTDIESVHAQLIAVVKRLRSDVADAVAAASFGDHAAYAAAPKKIERDTDELDSLADDFKAKGYRRLSLGAQ